MAILERTKIKRRAGLLNATLNQEVRQVYSPLTDYGKDNGIEIFKMSDYYGRKVFLFSLFFLFTYYFNYFGLKESVQTSLNVYSLSYTLKTRHYVRDKKEIKHLFNIKALSHLPFKPINLFIQ